MWVRHMLVPDHPVDLYYLAVASVKAWKEILYAPVRQRQCSNKAEIDDQMIRLPTIVSGWSID